MQIEAICKPNFDSNAKFPVLCCTIPAGSPDFVDDYVETHLELSDFRNNTDTTWFVKVSGESMIDEGI